MNPEMQASFLSAPNPSWPRCFFYYYYYYFVPLCLVLYSLTFERPWTFPGVSGSCVRKVQAIAQEGSYIYGTDFRSKNRNSFYHPPGDESRFSKTSEFSFISFLK